MNKSAPASAGATSSSSLSGMRLGHCCQILSLKGFTGRDLQARLSVSSLHADTDLIQATLQAA